MADGKVDVDVWATTGTDVEVEGGTVGNVVVAGVGCQIPSASVEGDSLRGEHGVAYGVDLAYVVAAVADVANHIDVVAHGIYLDVGGAVAGAVDEVVESASGVVVALAVLLVVFGLLGVMTRRGSGTVAVSAWAIHVFVPRARSAGFAVGRTGCDGKGRSRYQQGCKAREYRLIHICMLFLIRTIER